MSQLSLSSASPRRGNPSASRSVATKAAILPERLEHDLFRWMILRSMNRDPLPIIFSSLCALTSPLLPCTHISRKIESAAMEHAKELTNLAKRLSFCALALSSSEGDTEEDSSDEDAANSVINAKKKRPPKSQKSRSHKKRGSNHHSDGDDGSSQGSTTIASRQKRHLKSMLRSQPSRGRSRTPRDRQPSRTYRVFEGRQEKNQSWVSSRQGGYERREGNPDERGGQNGRARHLSWRPGGISGSDHMAGEASLRGRAKNIRNAMPRPRHHFDDNMLYCAADNISTAGQSVHGRSLGRYGRKAAPFPRPDDPIVKQLRLPVSVDQLAENLSHS